MNSFNMIIVIGIALILSISTIQAAPKYPKILPDDAPFLNSTKTEICSEYVMTCGTVISSSLDDTIGIVRLECVCPSGQQCVHDGASRAFKELQYYKCANKPSV